MRARLWADNLSLVAKHDPKAVARRYGFATKRGPYLLPDRLFPAIEAWAFAHTLVERSLESLSRAFAVGDSRLAEIPLEMRKPDPVDPSTFRLLLPLLFACSEQAQEVARNRSLSRSENSLHDQHDYFARLAAKLIIWEQLLWHIAADHGGPRSRIPYATTFDALEWFWQPSVHKHGDVQIPCLRCGRLIQPQRMPKDFPQCEHCNKNSNLRKPWPAHAIAPAERGTWLLRCQKPDCTGWYHSRPHRLRCAACPKMSDTSPGERVPLRQPRRPN
jgi:hypothetical protein